MFSGIYEAILVIAEDIGFDEPYSNLLLMIFPKTSPKTFVRDLILKDFGLLVSEFDFYMG